MAEVSQHEPGMFNWVDLMTTDVESAKEFYSRLLGCEPVDNPVGDDFFYTMLTLERQEYRRDVPAITGDVGAGDTALLELLRRRCELRGSGGEGGWPGRDGNRTADGRDGVREDGQHHRPDRRCAGAMGGEDAHRRGAYRRAGRVLLGRAVHVRHGGGGQLLRRPIRMGSAAGARRWQACRTPCS